MEKYSEKVAERMLKGQKFAVGCVIMMFVMVFVFFIIYAISV